MEHNTRVDGDGRFERRVAELVAGYVGGAVDDYSQDDLLRILEVGLDRGFGSPAEKNQHSTLFNREDKLAALLARLGPYEYDHEDTIEMCLRMCEAGDWLKIEYEAGVMTVSSRFVNPDDAYILRRVLAVKFPDLEYELRVANINDDGQNGDYTEEELNPPLSDGEWEE